MRETGRLVADGFAVADEDRIRRVEAHNAVVFDEDARHAVAGRGDDERVTKADFERPGFDLGIEIHLGRADAQMPFADDAGAVTGLLQERRGRRRAWREKQRGVAGGNTGAALAPSVTAGHECEARRRADRGG